MAYCLGMALPHVCFVTCLTWPDISESDRHVQRALEERGISVTGIPWNAPEHRLDDIDLAVFRSSWDYHHAPEAFLAWLAAWEGLIAAATENCKPRAGEPPNGFISV